jgi:hypothetical protein
MIPNHVLNDLKPGECVAVLARGEKLHFLVHAASTGAAELREHAERDGSEVLASHLTDKEAILRLVAGRERDLGGEG